MRLEHVLTELESRSDKRAIAVWQRLGMDIRNFYGVAPSQLSHLASQVGRDSNLAQQLWETEIHDARLLAIRIVEKKKIDEKQFLSWLNQADYWDLTDLIVKKFVGAFEAKEALKILRICLNSKREFVERSGYIMIGELAKKENSLTVKDFEVYLNKIDREIGRSKNWVKEGMLYALAAIGQRNKTLRQRALLVAKKVKETEVSVDYGDTAVKTPDIFGYLHSLKK